MMLLAVVVWPGCRREQPVGVPAAEAPSVAARTEAVTLAPVGLSYEATGTVRSKTAATIQSKIVGHVMAVHAKEGDVVELGRLLAEIDDREAVAQTQNAQSARDAAEKEVQGTKDSVAAAASAKAAADAGQALAKVTYERSKNLLDQQAISQQMFDEADAKKKQADAEASRAEQELKSAQARSGQAAAHLEQARAGLADAQVLLSYTKITAPVAGLVTMKNVDVGDLATPGAALFEIEDNQHYRLEASADEAQVGALHVGMKASVAIDALDVGDLAGTVGEIVPASDPASRTFIVKVDLPHQEGLHSGMFGRAKFSVGEKPLLTVPLTAIVEQGQLTAVYVVDAANRARLRLVKTGKLYGQRVEVLSGLSEGESVVVENTDRVQDGCLIKQI